MKINFAPHDKIVCNVKTVLIIFLPRCYLINIEGYMYGTLIMLNAFLSASLVSSTKGSSSFSLWNTFYLETKKSFTLIWHFIWYKKTPLHWFYFLTWYKKLLHADFTFYGIWGSIFAYGFASLSLTLFRQNLQPMQMRLLKFRTQFLGLLCLWQCVTTVEQYLYQITFNVGWHRLQIVLAGRVIIKRGLAACEGGTRIEYPGQH